MANIKSEECLLAYTARCPDMLDSTILISLVASSIWIITSNGHIYQIVFGLKRVISIADDLMIYGSGDIKEETINDHYRNWWHKTKVDVMRFM